MRVTMADIRSVYCVPGTSKHTLHIISHLIQTLQGKNLCYFPHFTEKEAGTGTSSSLCYLTELVVAESGLKSREPGSRIHALNFCMTHHCPPRQGKQRIFEMFERSLPPVGG